MVGHIQKNQVDQIELVILLCFKNTVGIFFQIFFPITSVEQDIVEHNVEQEQEPFQMGFKTAGQDCASDNI